MSQIPQFLATISVNNSSYQGGGFISAGSTKLTFNVNVPGFDVTVFESTAGDYSFTIRSTSVPPDSQVPVHTDVSWTLTVINSSLTWSARGSAGVPQGGSITVRHDTP